VPERSEFPTFSIICAAFQAKETVGRAVASVLAQTRADWELVVCDDGSSDATAATARQAAGDDARVTVFSQANAGPGAARNAAAARARGEFLVVLDADDEMRPHYLDSMALLASKMPGCDIYSCNALVRDSDGTESTWLPADTAPVPIQLTLADMLSRNRIFVMATVRTAAFERAGGFDASSAVEDYDLWLRILASGGCHAYTPAVQCVYHRRRDAASAAAARQWEATADLLARYAQDPALSPRERSRAEGGVRRYRGMATLARLAEDGAPDLDRSGAFAALAGYRSLSKRAAGALLAALSPRLFARVVGGRRRRALERRYGDDRGTRG